jgi:hypothetical protein
VKVLGFVWTYYLKSEGTAGWIEFTYYPSAPVTYVLYCDNAPQYSSNRMLEWNCSEAKRDS